jgi:hypothetical protein
VISVGIYLGAAELAILSRSETRGLAEHAREVGLGAEAEFQRNFDQGHIDAGQFLPRGLDTAIDYIAVR